MLRKSSQVGRHALRIFQAEPGAVGLQRLCGCLSFQARALDAPTCWSRESSMRMLHSSPYCLEAEASHEGLQPESLTRKALVNRLLYRSKQRGFLEMDLLVGLWAERNVPHLDEKALAAFTVVLDQENPDLFKWLTGQLPAPEHMLQNPAYKLLREDVARQLASNLDAEAHTPIGKDWVRGWDDWHQSTPAPQHEGGV